MATSIKQVAATAFDMSRDVKDSVADFGRSAGRKIDHARSQTGGALHAVASTVRKGSRKIDNFAYGTAKRLDATARFVEDADLKGLRSGARRFAQNHLTLTLLVSAVAGFWAASALNRSIRAHRAQ
jgi:hypothetical protein